MLDLEPARHSPHLNKRLVLLRSGELNLQGLLIRNVQNVGAPDTVIVLGSLIKVVLKRFKALKLFLLAHLVEVFSRDDQRVRFVLTNMLDHTLVSVSYSLNVSSDTG